MYNLLRFYWKLHLKKWLIDKLGGDVMADFLQDDTVVAIAADANAVDTISFVKIDDSHCIARSHLADDYGNEIPH